MNANTKEVSVVDFSDTPHDYTVYPIGYEDMQLSTLDNPYSPFNDYERWAYYDTRLGYETNRLLSRLVGSSSELYKTPLGKEIEDKFYYSTMLDIVRNNNVIPYVIVSPDDYKNDGTFKLLDFGYNKKYGQKIMHTA